MNKTIYDLIAEERSRQDEKWGEQNHTDYKWATILGEEYGEACKDVLDGKDPMKELIEVAAVAVAWVESILRKPTE